MDSFFKNIKDSKYLNNQINENTCVNINIVLAAGAAVGKTAFILRLLYENYKDYMKKDTFLHATCGYSSYLLALNYRDINIILTIWDTEWLTSRLFHIQKRLFENADIVFLLYESSSSYTFTSIKDKIYFFEVNCKRNAIFALICNKYDKCRNEISDEEALEFADINNMLFFHLSLHEKNETGIKELFETVLNEYFSRKEKEQKEYDTYY